MSDQADTGKSEWAAEPGHVTFEEMLREVHVQLEALQDHGADLNGKIPPEITVRIRPNRTAWIGCQCGTTFYHASGKCLDEAVLAFVDVLYVARTPK